MAPTPSSQTVAADRVTVSTVTKGRFDDFLPLRARVTPLVTVFLDAVEGGRVEKVLVEDGAMVQQGQLLAVLSNSDLQLNLLARQSDVSREVNSMRSQELALAQTRSATSARDRAQLAADKARRQYEMQKPLFEKGFVPARCSATAATNINPASAAPRCSAARRRPTSGCRSASSPSFAPPTPR
jgi:HlyD family secretion protein